MLAFLVWTDATGVVTGLGLLVCGALAWVGCVPDWGRWPAGSVPSRRAGRAYLQIGVGALGVVSADLSTKPDTAVVVGWMAVLLMLGGCVTGWRLWRQFGFEPSLRR